MADREPSPEPATEARLDAIAADLAAYAGITLERARELVQAALDEKGERPALNEQGPL